MRRSLDARHDGFPLSTPFRISRGVKTVADVVTVTVRQGDHAGRGEGVPYPHYGETVEGSLAAIEAVRGLIEEGASRAELAAAMPAGAARNALDCALWDLEARIAGTSVAALANRAVPERLASAITIGIDTPEAMAVVAARHAGVPLLKVKVNRREGAAQLAAVRAAAPNPRLIVDANESWRVEDVARWQDMLLGYRVDLLEQPVPAGEDAGLEGLGSRIPICADEALHTRDDLARLRGRYDYVNIKLDKTGGLTEALATADAAVAMGFGLMVGCMVGSSLGIAPAMLAAERASFVDLDGPLWLAADRAGGVRDEGGWMHPPAPGFWGTTA